jgi:uncharacterized protein
MELSGKVCVVTGASSGIGLQAALDLGAAGARVCVAARREERLADLVGRLGGTGRGHSYVTTDVSRKAQVKALSDHVRRTYGRLDVLVNNAGFSSERPLYERGGLGDLERVMKTNFFGAVYCTSAMLDLLIDAAPSNIVNVSSIAGRLAFGGAPAYCASKFALSGWSEALHSQLAGRGVCVSVVEPGLIPTEGFGRGAAEDPLLRHALGTTEGASRAILDAIENRKMERVVPRWYYLLQIPRWIAPAAYHFVQQKVVAPRRVRSKP